MQINKYTCNKCGIDFTDDDCLNNPFVFTHKFGYESIYDGETLSYYLCPNCTNEIIIDMNKNYKISIF